MIVLSDKKTHSLKNQEQFLSKSATIYKLNDLYQKKIPFLFIIDFDFRLSLVHILNDINKNTIMFDIEGFSNVPATSHEHTNIALNKKTVSYKTYKRAFDKVMHHIKRGDTYLLNLTFPSVVESKHSLNEIYDASVARYKLYLRDHFVVFSPETFVTIRDGQIFSFPMKGTIDASVPDAGKKIMQNKKEEAEHFTIVDLLRNDLSIVANNVHVDKFRYIERVNTNNKTLLQVSSKISGDIRKEYRNYPGHVFEALLPAGSISGAPKQRTIEIIKNTEIYERGFYTGVFGMFDGSSIKSAVTIRFIEQTNNGYVYKSGGGITFMSNPEEEYNELTDKIYVPVA